MWKLNNLFFDNQWVKEEITKEFRKYLETNEKHNIPKLTGYSESSTKREVHTDTYLDLKKISAYSDDFISF